MCCPLVFRGPQITQRTIALDAKHEIVVPRDLRVHMKIGPGLFVPQINTRVVWEYVFDNERFRRDFLERSNRTTFASYFVRATLLYESPECVEVGITVREAEPNNFTMSYATYAVQFVPA